MNPRFAVLTDHAKSVVFDAFFRLPERRFKALAQDLGKVSGSLETIDCLFAYEE
jgi:hypothetical protein